MADVSSPILYPPSSSPAALLEQNQKRFRDDLHTEFPSKRRLLQRSLSIDEEANRNNEWPIECADKTANTQRADIKTRGPFWDAEDEESPTGDGEIGSQSQEPNVPASAFLEDSGGDRLQRAITNAKAANGRTFRIKAKKKQEYVPYETLIGERSVHEPGRAKKSFYGIDIHDLIETASRAAELKATLPASVAVPQPDSKLQKLHRGSRDLLWTEKYRARKYTDLVGDERSHRDVLRWLKGWDHVVFPGASRPRTTRKFQETETESKPFRKILMLTGPPGLGKTTLAHVCARQAGYEVLEINASDERSRDVVKGKIKDCVGTDNVKGVPIKSDTGDTRQPGRPFCVVIDEVDGVVSGTGGGGEGGFIKALIDLVSLDQKNRTPLGTASGNTTRGKGKSDRFRLLRPIILICNDVYHPSLRPLRSTTTAEIIHLRKPPIDKIIARLKSVMDKEGIPCDSDGVRRLCEATWGLQDRREARMQASGMGEGDMRSILVAGEWVAAKLRTAKGEESRLSKKWVENNLLNDCSSGGQGTRGIGRGGAKEAVDRVFQANAGFGNSQLSRFSTNDIQVDAVSRTGTLENVRRATIMKLQEVVDTSGDSERIITDCFTRYPSQSFQDDTFLSKPNAAYEWLHFHDYLSTSVRTEQEWELNRYLSQSVLGFHHLFASSKRIPANDYGGRDEDVEEEPSPFSGPRADFAAHETLKQNKSILTGLQSSLSLPLLRSFRSLETLTTDLVPHILSMLTPSIRPVVIGGSGDQKSIVSIRKESEKKMVQRAVGIMSAVGTTFEKTRVEGGPTGISNWVYRMEPPLDMLATFDTANTNGQSVAAPVRYSIRQALDQEYQIYLAKQNSDSRHARYLAGGEDLGEAETRHEATDVPHTTTSGSDSQVRAAAVKLDFFGRPVTVEARPSSAGQDNVTTSGKVRKGLAATMAGAGEPECGNVWVSFHEGFSNAVRKPITLEELLRC